jgi:hypothetical protein
MKNFYTLLFFLLATVSILAQAPEKMSYQAVLRDASNTLLTNQEVGMQISILQSTITGTAVYIETQTATTNINGLVSLVIGSGTSSDDFSAIDWSAGPYFIKTATDPSGGSSYTITGTSQLMSSPFALYAKTSGSAMPGPQGEPGVQGAAGTQGIQGAIGEAGVAGTQGIQGAIGTAGTNGTNGAKGDVGAKGDTGDQGTQGIQGAIGSAGTNGTNGAKGDVGEKGEAGVAGPLGETGTKGDIGATGADGETGTKGDIGATGADGETGTKGDIGAIGADGETGTKGDIGATGADGASGAIGATGADGASGAIGATGADGASGAIGATGADGASGAIGATGKSGVGIAQTLSFSAPNLELSDEGGSVDLTAFMGWGLTGNSGTSGSTGASGSTGTSGANGSNFIGTTDDTPFNIRVNNVNSGRITSAGETFLGYQAMGYDGPLFDGPFDDGARKAPMSDGGLPDTKSPMLDEPLPDTSNSYRTAIGAYAQVAENFSTAIGFGAVAFATNGTAIGHEARVYADNTIQLGNTEVTAVHLGTGTNVTLQTGSVKITGGTPGLGKVLTSDAHGLASWQAVAIIEVADESSAIANQTTFTLSQIPSENSKVRMYVNGIRISNTAYDFTNTNTNTNTNNDTNLTYNPANNGGYALTVGDRIQFDYYHETQEHQEVEND